MALKQQAPSGCLALDGTEARRDLLDVPLLRQPCEQAARIPKLFCGGGAALAFGQLCPRRGLV